MASEEDYDVSDEEFDAAISKFTLRSCDGCTMCCTIMAVPEIDKPDNTACVHCETGKGCLIYDSRPKECRRYYCFWAASMTPVDLSPRSTKVVISGGMEKDLIIIHEDPKFPGSKDSPRLHKWYRHIYFGRPFGMQYKICARKHNGEYVHLDRETMTWKPIVLIPGEQKYRMKMIIPANREPWKG